MKMLLMGGKRIVAIIKAKGIRMKTNLMTKMIILSFMLITCFMLVPSNAVAIIEPPCFELLSCYCPTDSCIAPGPQGSATIATAVFGSCETEDELVASVDVDVNGDSLGVVSDLLPPGEEVTVQVITTEPGNYVTTMTATATDPSGNSTTVQCVTECSIPLCNIEVPVDIKPMSCPNPLNVKDQGVLSVAILGTDELDVTQIDPATVELEGVSPLRWSYEDVATPEVDSEGCNIYGADGYSDLVLKFNAQEVIAALGEVEDGQEIPSTITGELLNGTPIMGEDVVVILKKGE